ncbi:MAG: DNA replication/repair protein RecF [Christensenellaceae bacterium]
MHITKLALRDFRNFEALTLEDLNPGINVFAGRNAMGKTNLLEAVNYLSCARSFRGAPDAKLIRDGQAFAGIFAQYAADSHRGKIEIGILGEGKRSVRLNGLPVRKISELMGALNSIVFAPEDLRIIKEAPSLRRRMMDMELCKISPGYYRSLQSYSLALKSKNKLLKNPRADAGVLSAYSEQMAAYGEQMIEERAAFVEQLNACTARFYHNLQGVSEGIEIRYKCSAEVENARESLLAKMQANAAREREVGVCLTGPHREDLEILINGRDSKIYASQGQQRTAMLAIRLASLEVAQAQTGEAPVLLLDDVFSELDRRRRESLMEIVSGNQVFITCTDMEGMKEFAGASYFSVEEATVRRQ